MFGHCCIGDSCSVESWVLCCWAGSDTDSSTDQDSFAEAHWAVIDGQVPHTANIGLSGGKALWEEKIWKEGEYQHDEKTVVFLSPEKIRRSGVPDSPGAPPMNTGFLSSVELAFRAPTTWLTSESTSSWTTLASRITVMRQDRMTELNSQRYQSWLS